jgi:hypothetical protein
VQLQRFLHGTGNFHCSAFVDWLPRKNPAPMGSNNFGLFFFVSDHLVVVDDGTQPQAGVERRSHLLEAPQRRQSTFSHRLRTRKFYFGDQDLPLKMRPSGNAHHFRESRWL